MYQYLGSIRLFDFLGTISGIALFIFNLTQLKQKKLFLGRGSELVVDYFSNKRRLKLLSNITLWAVVETVLVACVQYLPPYNFTFGDMVGTGANYYGIGFLSPMLLMIAFYLISVDPLKQMDLITPAYPLALIFVKMACFCQGCCRGFECSYGLFNHKTGNLEFPVQLVEAGLALLIFIFLMFWRKKAKEGTMFPTYLILYSSTRFFSEFLRIEPEVVWILKKYHLFCLAGVIVGVIELVIVLRFGEKIRQLFTPNFVIRAIEKRTEKAPKKKAKHHKGKQVKKT